MDHVIDSESCVDCGHDHYPGGYVTWYSERRDGCPEPGCDCTTYKAPDRLFAKVYKCGQCGRMVTRITRTHVGQFCGECYDDE